MQLPVSPAASSFNRFLRRAIIILVPVNLALLLVGVAQYPPVLSQGGLPGLIAAAAIVLIYGFIALFSPISIGKAHPLIVRQGSILGLVGGFVLSADLISGYIIHDADTSARTSLVAYGFFFLLILTASVLTIRRTGNFSSGMMAAVWCVVTALLIWFCVEFVSFYLLASSPGGAAFVASEMQEDFARSGATDYQAFVISDFFGAGFFHLLLGLIIALILGALGTFFGNFRSHSSASTSASQ